MTKGNNRSRILALCICILFWICIVVFLSTSVSYSRTYDSVEGCISIAFFEKQKMRTVDKVVLRTSEKTITITDPNLVREVTGETSVATHTGVKFPPEGYIDLYSGDVLVRSMLWGIGTQTVKVYEVDLTHWVIVPLLVDQSKNPALAYLSDELAIKLNMLLEEN
ncbi:MAG: hypothetical protein IJO04_01565 [Oscillospiraceae bacterium]|nr:hypothetical protein [Oscillospiraceae bacterium]